MASVFKVGYRSRGNRRKTGKDYVEFVDHREIRQRVPTFRQKSAAAEFGRHIESLVAHHVASGGRLDPESIAWVQGLPAGLRDRLVSIGLVSPLLLGDSVLLTEHLDVFELSLRRKGTSDRQIRDILKLARRVIDGCGFRTYADIEPDAVEGFLHELRRDKDGKRGISAQTSNHHLAGIRQFCRWMVKAGRADTSTLEGIYKQNVDADMRHERRALEIDEARRLLTAAREGPVREGRRLGGKEPKWSMSGPDRELLYRLALETGLRANEIRSLNRMSFDLNGDPSVVAVKATSAKNKKRGNVVPLRPELVGDLRAHIAALEPGQPLFALPPKEHMAELLRGDLAAAGVAYRDEEGRVADFHSLRHTCATWLVAAGADPKTVQAILRHSTVTLTLDRYTHASRAAGAEAVGRLPELRAGSA